ncbi:hypothetical protein JCM10296v2_004274 [Rhodotorula toruloides]
MSPPPFQFVVGSRWPGWEDEWAISLLFARQALHSGFKFYEKDKRRLDSGERFTLACNHQGCPVELLCQPGESREDSRATILRANLVHNHPLRIDNRPQRQLQDYIQLAEKQLPLRALEQLSTLKKGYDYQLISSVTTPIHKTFARQNEILDDVGQILGHKAKEDLRKEAKEAGVLCEADTALRNETDSEPSPQAKAEKKDKQRAQPSPSPTPDAGPSHKRVKREASKEPEVLVLEDSDEEDVKPAQYAQFFSRRTIRIDNPEQLLKAVTAVPPCFDYLSGELGKDEVKADGTVEEGMPEFWRMMLRSELLKRAQDEQ